MQHQMPIDGASDHERNDEERIAEKPPETEEPEYLIEQEPTDEELHSKLAIALSLHA